jgi:antitoxin (DNA-binding transcriptional repressor) of toxin-antitoxin stability system
MDGSYSLLMTPAHAHELRAGEPVGPVADAVAEAEAGEISYLTRDGQPVVALVSVGELAALQASQDAHDIAEAESIRSRPGPLIPQDVIEAMMGADDEIHDAMAAALDAQAGADLPPDSVRAMWEAVRARSLP